MAVYESKRPTKDGRKYYFRIKYKDIFGEIHDYSSKKYKSRKDAVNEEAIYRIKISNNDTCTNNVTIDKIYQEYILTKKEKFKPQTIVRNNYLYLYLEPLKDKKINDINISVYKKFRNELIKKECDADYKNKIQGLLKQIIIYSNKYYNTSDSILKFIEPFKEANKIKEEMQFFTYEEYTKFDKVINNFEYHTFFETLYFMGLRQGEAQALCWSDINFEKEEIKITKTLTTKIKGENWTISSPKTKNSIRILPLPKNLLEDLKMLYNKAKAYKDFSKEWFIFGNTIPFKETTICKKKNKYCELADVKQIRIHDFRHSCASLLINKGASIVLVSKYLGHANISITLNTYTHMYKSELENITNLLNNL